MTSQIPPSENEKKKKNPVKFTQKLLVDRARARAKFHFLLKLLQESARAGGDGGGG